MFKIYQLEVFKRVVETGSFNRAANAEYITTNAVARQINNLEAELGVKLLNRTHNGIELTEPGKLFYKETLTILDACEGAAERIKAAALSASSPIRLGVSSVHPTDAVKMHLENVLRDNHDISIDMVPFENSSDSTTKIYGDIGSKIDVLVSSFDDETLKYWNINGLELYRERVYACVSVKHRLAEKESILIRDLIGEEVLFVRESRYAALDDLREHMEKNYPGIKIIDVPGFGMKPYNKVAKSNQVFLGIGENIHAHPLAKRLLISDWEEQIPAGIVYAKNPSAAVKKFVQLMKNEVK